MWIKQKLLIPKHHCKKLDIKKFSLKIQIWSNSRMIAVFFGNIKQTKDWFTNIKFRFKQNKKTVLISLQAHRLKTLFKVILIKKL